jgi:hypothetical protein
MGIAYSFLENKKITGGRRDVDPKRNLDIIK